MIASFTQFLRPNGQEVLARIVISDDLQEQIAAIERVDARLTVEVLTTGEVSFAIEHDLGDFDSTLEPNGPTIPLAVDRLIRRFDLAKFEQWRDEAQAAEGKE